MQEQRRLFYVALTRARDRLVVTLPAGTRCGFVDEVLQAGHGGRLQRTAKPGPPCPRPPPLACAQARALCASRP